MAILSTNEVAQLVEEIKADAATADNKVKDLFCKLWPDAKKAIDALLQIIKNPVAKAVLQLVEAIGDGAQKAFCK